MGFLEGGGILQVPEFPERVGPAEPVATLRGEVPVRAVIVGYQYPPGRPFPEELFGIPFPAAPSGEERDLASGTRVRHSPEVVSLLLPRDGMAGLVAVDGPAVPDPFPDRPAFGNQPRLFGFQDVRDLPVGYRDPREIRKEAGNLRVRLVLDDRLVAGEGPDVFPEGNGLGRDGNRGFPFLATRAVSGSDRELRDGAQEGFQGFERRDVLGEPDYGFRLPESVPAVRAGGNREVFRSGDLGFPRGLPPVGEGRALFFRFRGSGEGNRGIFSGSSRRILSLVLPEYHPLQFVHPEPQGFVPLLQKGDHFVLEGEFFFQFRHPRPERLDRLFPLRVLVHRLEIVPLGAEGFHEGGEGFDGVFLHVGIVPFQSRSKADFMRELRHTIRDFQSRPDSGNSVETEFEKSAAGRPFPYGTLRENPDSRKTAERPVGMGSPKNPIRCQGEI